jgi:predicted AlkP superfamily pyrophosphatase or phosphodiesterase
MALVVLALDAADIRHAEDFDCENILLDEHTKMQSVAHRLDHPHTGEAWPSIATGLHPTEHGITGHGEWDSTLLTVLSRVAHALNLSRNIRSAVGDRIKEKTEHDWQLQTVDAPTFLDGEFRAVHNWPGVYRNEAIHYVWDLFHKLQEGDLSEQTFTREAYTEAASKFGWAVEALDHEVELVATHVHILDVFGHMYADDEARYREIYADVDEWIGGLRDSMSEEDELLILSDHGMEAEWLDDEEPGSHSWRAIASSTGDSPPEHALDVKEWVESRIETVERKESDLEIPEEQLRELGYIE